MFSCDISHTDKIIDQQAELYAFFTFIMPFFPKNYIVRYLYIQSYYQLNISLVFFCQCMSAMIHKPIFS